jgi:hypothetical protein
LSPGVLLVRCFFNGEAAERLDRPRIHRALFLAVAVISKAAVVELCLNNPEASISDYLKPMIGKLMYQAYAGPNLLGRLGDSAADAAELIIALPRRIDRVLGELERGNLRIWTRVEGASIRS